jgi:hypothetical protein
MTNLRNNGFAASEPLSDEIRRDEGFAENHVLNDNGGLSSFHHFEEEEEGSGKAKMIGGALVVALLLGGAGIYMFSGGTSTPQTTAAMPVKAPAQMASNTPAPAPVAAPVAPTDNATPTASPYDAAPAAAPAAPATAAVEAKPVKSAKVIHKESKQNEAKIDADESSQTAALNRSVCPIVQAVM